MNAPVRLLCHVEAAHSRAEEPMLLAVLRRACRTAEVLDDQRGSWLWIAAGVSQVALR